MTRELDSINYHLLWSLTCRFIATCNFSFVVQNDKQFSFAFQTTFLDELVDRLKLLESKKILFYEKKTLLVAGKKFVVHILNKIMSKILQKDVVFPGKKTTNDALIDCSIVMTTLIHMTLGFTK